ncbi:hypothetical protein FQR65_LT07611 [Abscondita terminalis]|nr:hypothetical protein FQR65_LT07611 [Abscondita terminalis]
MRSKNNILHGPKPVGTVEDGTVGNYMFNMLKKYASLPACITEPETNKTISYRELLESTCRLAQSLTNNGYHQNTVISICSDNCIYCVYPTIAAFYRGLIVAPINPNYTEREMVHILSISKPQVMFCSKNTLAKVKQVQKKLSFLKKLIVLDSKDDIMDVESLQNFIKNYSETNFNVEKFEPFDFDRDEQVAIVLCSSGTTGLPKGVMLTHKNFMLRFMHCRDPEYGTARHVKEGGTVLNFMPLFHNFGCTVTLGYLTLGLHIIQLQKYTNELFLESIQKYKVKSTLVVPPIMVFLVKSDMVDKYDLSSLTEIGCGAAPLSKEIITGIENRLHIKNIRQGYGLTETTLVVSLTPLNGNKVGSAGKLLPLNSAKIVDIDTKKCLGPYELGEIYFKGDLLMKGYMGNNEATRDSIDDDGWFHTGDIGYYDDEEYFFVVDRIKELIKYKGFQVAPAEIEALLLEHPKIKECAVVGKPDDLAGELPTAFIVNQPGENLTDNEVHDYLKDKISNAKRLRGGIKFVDAIPRNSTGKILRRELKEALQQQSKL